MQVQLPATPPPGEAVQPTPAEKAPRPAPGAEPPANTPLAAEVLAGFGLGFLATTAAEVSANDTPEAPAAPRQHSGSSAGSMPMVRPGMAAEARGARHEHCCPVAVGMEFCIPFCLLI